MTARAPLDRLDAQDFYRLLDSLRDNWGEDEVLFTRRLARTERVFLHLPTPLWLRARPLLQELGWARVVADRPWRETIVQLGGVVADWARARPPLLACPHCTVTVRGHEQMAAHRRLFHDEGVPE